jgi:hypothetical protein
VTVAASGSLGVLIACGVLVVVGTLIPLLFAGRAASKVLAYVLIGPLVAIAVAAGGGAALAGGMSIQSNKGKDGRVDWGRGGS